LPAVFPGKNSNSGCDLACRRLKLAKLSGLQRGDLGDLRRGGETITTRKV
jgi:hypothetical protein